jgi:hypothetical protein
MICLVNRRVRSKPSRLRWLLLLVWTIAFASSEDPSAMPMAGSGSGLLLVATEDDDSDGGTDRMSPVALDGARRSHVGGFARESVDVTESADLSSTSWLRRPPRGPPCSACSSSGGG